MRVLLTGLSIFVLLLGGMNSAKSACVTNIGSDWRKVGAGGKVKYVCKNDKCGGSGNYVFVRKLKAARLQTHGFFVSMKNGGKNTRSPISGLSGIHKEITSNKIHRILEVYYAKNKVGVDMVYIEASGNSKAVAKSNFSAAKRSLVCR